LAGLLKQIPREGVLGDQIHSLSEALSGKLLQFLNEVSTPAVKKHIEKKGAENA
jgi:transcriptional regulator of aromatic amino acid metabolism